MIEPRLYRAAFLPAVLALVVTMFSFASRPPALPQGLPADVLFEGTRSIAEARELATDLPDRRPGTRANRQLADRVARTFAQQGFETRLDRFEAEGRSLVNVIGRRPGPSSRQIVIAAARDAGSVPDATSSAADTAALLEFARVFEGRAPRKTIVLASLDGSTLGDAGARRLAEDLGGPVDAVLVMSNLGAPRPRGSVLVPWSNDPTRESIGLQRTAAEAIRLERGGRPELEGAPGQLVRIGFPVAVGAQGVLLDRGVEAIRFSGSGELPPPERAVRDLDAESFGALGRAVLRTFSTLDAAPRPPVHGPERYLLVARRVIPGWALSALALALILPALVAAVDGFARARRQREPVGRAVRWVLLGALAAAGALVPALLLDLLGLLPGAPPAPFPPSLRPVTAGAVLALALIALAGAGAWVYGRGTVMRYLGGDARPADPATGVGLGLVLAVATVLVWLLNPIAALLLAPTLHLWLIAAMSGARARLGVPLLLGGLLLPLLAVLYYMVRLRLDPLEGAWYLVLLVTGGHVGPAAALLGCVLLGALGSLVAILWARTRRPEPPPPRPSVRGPVTYAGPGSLGGTRSALRR